MYACGQILTLRCMTTPSQNFVIMKGVGLWARAHLKKEDGTDTLRGRASSLIKLVACLFQTDCLHAHGGANQRVMPGGGPGCCTAQLALTSRALWRGEQTLRFRARAPWGQELRAPPARRDNAPGKESGCRLNTVRNRRVGFSGLHE